MQSEQMTAERQEEIESASEAYFSLGVPVVAMKEKQPLAAWQRWQDTPQTLQEFRQQPWASATGFAVICGTQTRNGLYFLVIDCDDPQFDTGLLRTTQTEKTPRGGYHFIYHSKVNAKGQKSLDQHIELLGNGNLVIMHPSLGYQRLNDNLPSEVDSAEAIYGKLVSELGGSAKREVVNIKDILKGVPVGQRDASAIKLATYYRKKGLNQAQTIEKLCEWNRKNAEPLASDVITQKAESAYSTPEPYKYQFQEEPNGEDAAFPEIPEPIPYESAEELDQEIYEYVKERIDFTYEEDYAVFVAAVKLTWVLEKFDSTPYLFFYGPKRSGKTRALKLLEQLCYRGFLALNATRATIYYLVDEYTPTLLLDETEVYTTNDPDAKEIQCLLNSGYQRGGRVMRLEPDEHGKRHLRFWRVFCLKALSGTRYVSETLEDRCIVFKMTQNSYPIKPLDESAAKTLRGKLAAWKQDFLSGKDVSRSAQDVSQTNMPSHPDKKDVSDVSDVSTSTTTTINELINDITIIKDERLKELFIPLASSLLEKRLKRLIRLKAIRIAELWESENRLSLDAEILEAIKGVAKIKNRFASGSVTDMLNATRREDEKVEARAVGWIIRRLGFNQAPKLESKARAWWWDEQLWAKRARQFNLECQLKLDGGS